MKRALNAPAYPRSGSTEAAELPPSALAALGRSTFAWAGHLLPRACRQDVLALYAFCRQVDDLADRSPHPEVASARLAALQAALSSADARDPLAAVLLDLARRYDFAPTPAIALVEGVREDLEPVRIESFRHLVRYAYRVAGTVGEMMCAVLGCRDRAAVPFAVDLGIGMQLTNISRDVLEDARAGRLYLPADGVGSLTPEELVAGDRAARAVAWQQVTELLTLAEQRYRQADRGIALLPPRARFGVLVASRMYEAIGTAIRHGGEPRYWQRRARVGRRAAVVQTLRSVAALPGLVNAEHTAAPPVAELRPFSDVSRQAQAGWRGGAV